MIKFQLVFRELKGTPPVCHHQIKVSVWSKSELVQLSICIKLLQVLHVKSKKVVEICIVTHEGKSFECESLKHA